MTADPTVRVLTLDATNRFLVLGSDGLFDALSYSEVHSQVCAYRAQHGSVVGAAKALADEVSRWISTPSLLPDPGLEAFFPAWQAIGRNVLDNITVVVVEFLWGDPE